MKDITIAYSPCPNDCFIFDALIHKRIDTRGYNFIPVLADVESLNQAAFRGEYDVTKLSYHAFAYCCDEYIMLASGSALGNNCGPLLISKRDISHDEVRSGRLKIAIPGKFTTANFLFSIAFPEAKDKRELVFSQIENAVLDGTVDAGLIIHENRFTYEKKGLRKIIDLGEFWESTTQQPIPLGGIAIKRNREDAAVISDLIAESVRYAFAHPEDSMLYVREHAAEMDAEVMKQHINLYVNQYSVDLGETGRNAVHKLFSLGQSLNIIPQCSKSLIVSPSMQND